MLRASDRVIIIITFLIIAFIGPLVLEEIKSGQTGMKYPPVVPTFPAISKNRLPDHPYSYFGKENHDFDALISKIKSDLENESPEKLKGFLRKAELRVFVGDYDLPLNIVNAALNPSSVDSNIFYIAIDSVFFRELNEKEKEALIGHEVGHLPRSITIVNKLHAVSFSPKNRAKAEIEADTTAAKYAGAAAVLSLLHKANWQYELRRESLERIKKQGK